MVIIDKITFRLGGDNVEVVINGDNLLFSDISTGTITTIEGLKISKGGVIKEFPDLKDDSDWKKKALDRFKKNMKSKKSPQEKIDYIIYELSKHGYEPLFSQRAGHRPKKIRWHQQTG